MSLGKSSKIVTGIGDLVAWVGHDFGIVQINIFVEKFDADGGTTIFVELIFDISVHYARLSCGCIPDDHYFYN